MGDLLSKSVVCFLLRRKFCETELDSETAECMWEGGQSNQSLKGLVYSDKEYLFVESRNNG